MHPHLHYTRPQLRSDPFSPSEPGNFYSSSEKVLENSNNIKEDQQKQPTNPLTTILISNKVKWPCARSLKTHPKQSHKNSCSTASKRMAKGYCTTVSIHSFLCTRNKYHRRVQESLEQLAHGWYLSPRSLTTHHTKLSAMACKTYCWYKADE